MVDHFNGRIEVNGIMMMGSMSLQDFTSREQPAIRIGLGSISLCGIQTTQSENLTTKIAGTPRPTLASDNASHFRTLRKTFL
jgi:hypothetical protein